MRFQRRLMRVDSRTTNSAATNLEGGFCLFKMSIIAFAAETPISYTDWRTDVKGGKVKAEWGRSSKPINEMSSGTRKPDLCNAKRAP
jgi:hypothetical protein